MFLSAFDAYADALFRHAYFRVSDREKAKDLVADAYTKTWDYIRKGNEVDDFRPFLYRTLNRLIIDEYRKKKSVSLDALLEDQEVPEGAFEELFEGGIEDMEFKLDAKRVPDMLKEMPHVYREVVVMRFFDGLLPGEIAEMLGEPVNNVSVRIHRGVQWLIKYVDDKENKKND